MPARIDLDEAVLRDLVEVKTWTIQKVADHFGVSKGLIERRCKTLRLKTQRTGPRAGAGHPNWTGGRVLDKSGYVLVYRPDHPRARRAGPDRKPRYVLEHILVMELLLGRSLTRREVVHHIDGNPANNAPTNLMLFGSNADHLRHELTGHCPKWTPEGRERILAALRGPKPNRRKRQARGARP